MAGAITGGNITLSNGCPEHVQATLQALKDCGFVVSTKNKTIQLKSEGPPSALSVSTAPYPGFATDMQAQLMALLSTGVGRSQILESIFENRFMHVPELLRLGADIQLQGNTAFINGLSSTGKNFSGATVMATDLRASACLVLAGLAASGKTTVRRIYHLDRGYEKLELKLQALGARVWREKE
jgi:UDP-N-acetylglucosamine 1-carboxyvinyltransferase